LSPGCSYQTLIHVKDRPTPDGQPHTVQFRRISPDYVKPTRIKTRHGSGFTDEDVVDRPQVTVVCRRFAEGLFSTHRRGRPDPGAQRAKFA
jgi:hypothetical protein